MNKTGGQMTNFTIVPYSEILIGSDRFRRKLN